LLAVRHAFFNIKNQSKIMDNQQSKIKKIIESERGFGYKREGSMYLCCDNGGIDIELPLDVLPTRDGIVYGAIGGLIGEARFLQTDGI